ncbi:MAG: hypothetical protein HZY77_10555 [Thiobacillus sp.]|uniref:hypothetical protein n=1 Tax=Thiobacillus sp. TaxID=924 RepID=UPI00168C9201|nr:hypothetical protein [Thiobacillus sp.]QLQ03161.1 MAG: hypothetical protein HZY77_10555 [Thiobacillus sp.]
MRILGGIFAGLVALALMLVAGAVFVAQLFVGFKGIALGLGTGWAWAAVVVALILRFTLPITIGAVYGAIHVLGWPWYWAVLFAAPGLLFMVPGFVALVVSSVVSFVGSKRGNQAQGS